MSKKNSSPISTPMTRRDFFKVAFGALSGFLTLALSWPLFSFLISPPSTEEKSNFVKVPNFSSIPVGKPTKLTFQYIEEQAFLRQNIFYDIWVIKQSPTQARVLSPLCTHLSCRYNWNANDHVFACPCHGSVFNPEGEVMAGPAPRPLDELPYKIQDGELYVNWKVFKPGIHQKVEV
jgi:menaquinol-cytochrome c reductase iron-sulfur subunit